MRIGMIAGEYPPMQGGVGAYTQILARELAQQGHDLYLYASPGAEESDSRLRLTPGQGWRGPVWRYIDAWAQLNRLDVVNLQYQTAAFSMSPMIHFIPERVRFAPVVTTAHDLRFPYLFPKAGPLRPWFVQRMLSRSAGVILTNHEDFAATSAPRKVLIPIGSNILSMPDMNDQHRVAVREGLRVSYGEFLIVFFGLLNASKGLDTLIDALAQCRKAHADMTLVVIGDVGTSDPTNAATAAALRAQNDRLGLAEHVRFTGFVDEARVAEILLACDAIALPFRDGASFRRGSLMAAIRYGRPIITTQPQVTIPEFTHGEPLFLIPPDDPAALASMLGHVASLRHEGEHWKRIAGGTAALSAHFQWDAIARRSADFFSQVSK
ncbi:MAG: glycosyltransferase family 4 protein [Pleurocapsa minor GSE-CHR-MK-17-07R]|jgi:glycosyltransferase involved in cell wall biosynthesis|nr:glycosyltransferase family 4 protein [Pleurocapsa minor GSE-CHR-MK 17-07R]